MINNEWGIRARMWQLLFGDVLVRRVHVLVKRLNHKQEYVEWSSILCVIFVLCPSRAYDYSVHC